VVLLTVTAFSYAVADREGNTTGDVILVNRLYGNATFGHFLWDGTPHLVGRGAVGGTSTPDGY